MQNLRVVSDNAAERAAIVASNSASASYAATNLGTEPKSDLWRGLGKVERLDFAWGTPEPVAAVGLAYCNWSPTAMMRVRASAEGAMTNLLKYSEQFNNAIWSKQLAIIAAAETDVAGIIAPDGTTTAERFRNDGVVNAQGYMQQPFTADGVTRYCASVYVKAEGITTAQLDLVQANGASYVAGARTTLNLSSGVATLGNGYSKSVFVGNGWYRISVAGIPTAGTGHIRIALPADATAGTAGYFVWGAQVEAGDVASSYYPTAAAAATRPAGYVDSWQSYDYDSGWAAACPAVMQPLRRLTAAQSASAYSLGGGAFARHWLPATVNALRVVVDVNDANNLQGFVEATNAIIGPVWQAKKNVDYGVEATPLDFSKSERSAAGDLLTARSFRAKKLRFALSKMDPDDANAFWEILRTVGASYPIWVSVAPEDDDVMFEAVHQVYGKFITTPSMSRPSFRIASASPEVESI